MKWRLQLKASNVVEGASVISKKKNEDSKSLESKPENEADYDENEKLEDEIKEALCTEKKLDKK